MHSQVEDNVVRASAVMDIQSVSVWNPACTRCLQIRLLFFGAAV